MWKQNGVRLAALIIGFLLIPTGLFLALRRRPARNPDYEYLTTHVIKLGSKSDGYVVHFLGPGMIGPEEVQVKAPKSLHIGESASVYATASLDKGFLTALKHANANPLTLNLAAAGLEVEPKEWLHPHLSEDGAHWVAAWSIRASSPGSYHLVFNPRFEEQVSDAKEKVAAKRSQEMPVKFEPQADLTIEVVQGWRDWVSIVGGPFTGFMGSLLTLPGILALRRRWKRRREVREESQKSAVFE